MLSGWKLDNQKENADLIRLLHNLKYEGFVLILIFDNLELSCY